MYIATFRLLNASFHQAMRSTGYAAPFKSRWSAVIGVFRSSLFRREVVASGVRCCTTLLLCFSIVCIHASGISIPVSLLMLDVKTGHYPLWNEVKFINRDSHWYTRRIKEAIHIRLHPNNINRDSGIEIPEAWMPTIKKHNRRVVQQQTAKATTSCRNSEDQNAPITADHRVLSGAA